MKNKKRLFTVLLCIVAVLACLGAVVACGEDTVSYTYRFVKYGDEVVSVTGVDGSDVAFPTVTRDGYAFDGWYDNAECTGAPVTSAKFSGNVTLYAKWTALYAATIDLDGGSMSGLDADNKLYIREGANIYTFMQSYTPTRDGNGFGGWYVGDTALANNAVMTSAGISLLAKYTAEYKINVMLQNVDLDGYTLNAEASVTGNMIIDEELDLADIEVQGFVLNDSELDDTTVIIDRDSSNNEYTLNYDRCEYELVLEANYPNGSSEERSLRYHYGVEFDLPTDAFACDGSRFLGWSTSTSSTGMIDGTTYTLTAPSTVLYAIWNIGYRDMFSGEDVIFVTTNSTTNVKTAVLYRGGVDIDGTYDEDRDYYIFRGEAPATGTTLTLRARLNEDTNRFVYYSDRSGSYTLYDNGDINSNITLTVDNINEIAYYDNTSGSSSIKRGVYSLDENGLYVAEFEDGTSFTFITGTVTQENGNPLNVFRVRGDEYTFGTIGMYGVYYPALTFDGFGNVLYIQSSQSSMTLNYIRNDNEVTLFNAEDAIEIRLFVYGSGTTYNGYEPYDEDMDITYSVVDGSKLILDGCSNVTYKHGAESETGKYVLEQSIRGGYILSFIANGEIAYKFRVYNSSTSAVRPSNTFDILETNYTEYFYADNDGKLVSTPYLVVNGTAAYTYELLESGNGVLLGTTGTIVENTDGSYSYTSSRIEANAENKYQAFTYRTDLVSSSSASYNVYYMTSVKIADVTETYDDTVYRNGADTLKLVSAFGIYTVGGETISGICTNNTTYRTLIVGDDAYYFILDDTNKTFELLARQPIVLTKRVINPETGNPLTTRAIQITMTGKQNSQNAYETIYRDATDADNVVTLHGYSTENVVEELGVRGAIYSFASDDGTMSFKYTIPSSNSNYFMYYEANVDITVMSLVEIDDDDITDTNKVIKLTDKKSGDKFVVTYTDGTNNYSGTLTAQTVNAFDAYTATVYTFTASGAQFTLRFTVVGNYFRVCAEDETLTSDNGTKLELNGATHIARYTYADGTHVESGYLVDTFNGMRAITILVDEQTLNFDVVSESEHKFELRGEEARSYFVVVNGNLQTVSTGEGDEEQTHIITLTLDGHGGAVVTTTQENATKESGTYTETAGVYTITVGGTARYIGELGSITIGENDYNAFFTQTTQEFAGAYIDKISLSVLNLDSVGNVVKYSSYGVRTTGRYIRLDDNVFYYSSDDKTDAGLYTINSDGSVTLATYHATYYAADFRSIVFYTNGVVLVDNDTDNATYFTYDNNKVYVYEYEPDNAANKYGYVKREKFAITNLNRGATATTGIVYGGTTYYYFDGRYITFNGANGSTLTFQPSGAATFTAAATYKPSQDADEQTQFVVVGYDDDGNVTINMANYTPMNIKASTNRYTMFVACEFELNYEHNTFVYAPQDSVADFIAYDYMYMQLVSTYGETIAAMLGQNMFGEIVIINEADEWTVAGVFNRVKVDVPDETAEGGTRQASLSFEGATLSDPGLYNSNYGHMFACRFVGNDNELYNLNFFLLPNGTYIIYSLSRVTETVEVSDNCTVYRQELVYSMFNITKRVINEQEQEYEYYVMGDEFVPAVLYNGMIRPVSSASGFNEADSTLWELYSREYTLDADGDTIATEYYYQITVRREEPEEGEEEGAIVIEGVRCLVAKTYSNEDGSQLVGVLEDLDSGEIARIFGLRLNGASYTVTEEDCVKVDNGIYEVTVITNEVFNTESTFVVTFTEEDDGNGSTVVKVTVELKADENEPQD